LGLSQSFLMLLVQTCPKILSHFEKYYVILVFRLFFMFFLDISCFGLVIIGNVLSFQYIGNIKSFSFSDTFSYFSGYFLFLVQLF
jgi:hypothetical protein